MDIGKRFCVLTGDRKFSSSLSGISAYAEKEGYDFLFSTCEMMVKDEYLRKFAPETFDYIVIDEVHRAGSKTYEKIIDYFRPEFLLGMTATPERTEDENKIYELFDHNVIYEIRLQDAMEQELLCPFHYYGITDLKGIDDRSYQLSDFHRLFTKERLDYIIEKSQFYGYSGDRLRGLIFVSRKEEGKELALLLEERGYHAAFLSGENDQKEREESIALLEEKDKEKPYLDFLITVDIFNEGVDIPEVNQILLLRPTISPIVFIQQPGRGLRRWEMKDFVGIIDFIGNYDNNYMIPQAFAPSGDKEEARMVVSSCYLPGISTIEFDEIARDKIFRSLSKARMNTFETFRSEYRHLKNKLGRIPSLVDFLDYSEFDPLRILQDKRWKSYPAFLSKMKEEGYEELSLDALDYLAVLGQILGKGLRKDEALFLSKRIQKEIFLPFVLPVSDEGQWTDKRKTTILNEFRNDYFQKKDPKQAIVSDWERLSIGFSPFLSQEWFKKAVVDLIEFSLKRNERHYGKGYRDTGFTLFERYTRDDVSVLFDLEKSHGATFNGYQHPKGTNLFPIFVNYVKAEDISEATKYEDHFVDPTLFSWTSRHGEKKTSANMRTLIHHHENGTKVYLFVQKSTKEKEERGLHYFLGEMDVLKSYEVREKGYDYVRF